MSSSNPKQSSALTGSRVVTSVYIPAALLIVGTALVDLRFVPVAILVAGALGAWTIRSSGTARGILGIASITDLCSCTTGSQTNRVSDLQTHREDGLVAQHRSVSQIVQTKRELR